MFFVFLDYVSFKVSGVFTNKGIMVIVFLYLCMADLFAWSVGDFWRMSHTYHFGNASSLSRLSPYRQLGVNRTYVRLATKLAVHSSTFRGSIAEHGFKRVIGNGTIQKCEATFVFLLTLRIRSASALSASRPGNPARQLCLSKAEFDFGSQVTKKYKCT